MRSLLLLFLCLVTITNVFSAMTEKQLQSSAKLIRKGCQPKTKASDASIDNIQKGIFDDEKSTKCYTFCGLSMLKLIDKNGNPDEKSARAQLELLPVERQEAAKISGENCQHAADDFTDKCDKAYALIKCFYFDNPQNFFSP